MVLYVDSSALLKRYVDEHDSDAAASAMSTDPVLVTSRITEVEVRRNLVRLLDGQALIEARRQFSVDLDAFGRSLDSLHLAAARRAGSQTALLTFDVRQAQVARALGFRVLGA